MAVKAQTLARPERDLTLQTREDDERPAVEVTAPGELDELRARIEQARQITPHGAELHCADCFRRGRDAAIRVIEGKARG